MKYLQLTKTNCKNCYKCLRSCPVKAIKFNGDQAEIVNDRCIACSLCRAVCPQNSLEITSELSLIKEAIASKKTMIASIAPSFPAAFNGSSLKLVTALNKLGFKYVHETASGAHIVTSSYIDYMKNNPQDIYITTACPSTNYLVEKYYPNLIKYLFPVVSPMIAHGKLLREIYGKNAFIVFIGPCTGKKIESHSYVNIEEDINGVLSFEELKEWFDLENMDLSTLCDTPFSDDGIAKNKSYPFVSGIVSSMKDLGYTPTEEVLSISGTEDCVDILKSVERGEIHNALIEISACEGSCIGGINMEKHRENYYMKKLQVKNYIEATKDNSSNESPSSPSLVNLSRSFIDKTLLKNSASEGEIIGILREMGKYKKEDELNCGVCGYNTCRDKAQAIHEGMAESNMCLYNMRSKAESLTNVIFEHTASCILLLDGNMLIKEINPSGEKVFLVPAADIKNKPVSILMDDTDFKFVKHSDENIIGKRVVLPKYNAVFIQSIIYIAKHDMIMVSMTNVLEFEKNQKKLQDLKENTLRATHEVIDKQMRVAQEIASLLGETTAETKMVLTKLKKLVEAEDGDIL